jgi:hypothetical protein
LRWLARPEPDLGELRELMREVVTDARRAADVIGRVRTLATRKPVQKALLSLDEVIREALLFLRHEIEARAVTVTAMRRLPKPYEGCWNRPVRPRVRRLSGEERHHAT